MTLAACAVLSVVAAALPLGPEHARLTAMTGTWNVEMTFRFRPDGPPVPVKAMSTIRPILGGQFIEETIEGALNGTPFTTLAWTGYNTWHQRTVIQQSSPGAMTAASYLSFGSVPEWKAVEIKYVRRK